MLNLWRCQHCGQQEIEGTEMLCPQCGATRSTDDESRIGTDRRIDGPTALALARGDWKYCGYCSVRVAPVDEAGKPHEVCPYCGGPLSEAEKEAALQLVSAEQASTYQADVVQKVGDPASATTSGRSIPTATKTAPKPRKPWSGVVALLVLIGLCTGGYLLCFHTWTKQMKVVGRSWQRSVQIEKHGPVVKQDWQRSLPSDAYNKSCSRKVHHHDKIPDGTESYQERVADGRRCVAHGYKKKGGVSVKQCTSWETKYKTVTKTRTKYRHVPVYRQYCSYTVVRWHPAGAMTANGSGADVPKWPDTSALNGKKQRTGERQQSYSLVLEYESESEKYECKDQSEWDRYPLGCDVVAEVTALGKLKRIKRAD